MKTFKENSMRFLALIAILIGGTTLGSLHAQCTDPNTLSAVGITYNSADLYWIPTGGEVVWDVELRTSASTFTGIPTASGVGLPYNNNTLLPGTSYTFYVRANCGGSTSGWAGPYSFSTLAAPPAPANDNICNASTLNFSTITDIRVSNLMPLPITCNTTRTTNVSATMEPSEVALPGSPCSVGGGNHHTIWYKFVAPCIAGSSAIKIRFSTANEGNNTNTFAQILQSASGTCTGPFTAIACNNDYTSLSGIQLGCDIPSVYFGGSSTVNMTGLLTAGNTYYIRVGGYSVSNIGTIVSSLTLEADSPTVARNPINPATRLDMSVANTNASLYTWTYHPDGSSGFIIANTTVPTFTTGTLSSGTTYDAQAAHRCGSIMYRTPLIQMSTAAITGCGTPIINPSCGSTSNSITVLWTALPGATGYRIYAKRAGATGYSYYNAPSGISSYTVTGLAAGTAYEIWVSAICSPDIIMPSTHIICNTQALARMSNPENEFDEKPLTFTAGELTYVNVAIADLEKYGFEFPSQFNGYIDFSNGETRYLDHEGGKEINPKTGAVIDASNDFNISLMPNPSQSKTTVSFNTAQTSTVVITLMDLNGEGIMQKTIQSSEGNNTFEISTQDLASGIYLVNLRMNERSVTRKLVVQH